MTYIFGNTYPPFIKPEFELGMSNGDFVVTHIKSGINYSVVPAGTFKEAMNFEEIAKAILKDCPAESIVYFTQSAIDGITQIAHINLDRTSVHVNTKF